MKSNSFVKAGRQSKTPELAWYTIENDKLTTIWPELSLLFKLLRITGIIIQEPNSTTNTTVKYILRIAVILPYVATFLYIASEVAYCGFTKSVTMSVVICMSLTLGMSFMLWLTMFCKRKSLSYLIRKLEQNRRYLPSTSKNSKISRHIRLASIYIMLIPIVTSTLSILSVQPQDTHFYLNCYFFGNVVIEDNFYDKLFLFIFLTIENYTQFLLPNIVTLMVYIFCEYFSQAIEVYVELCKSGHMSKTYSPYMSSRKMQILKLYKNLRDTFKFLESVTSFPIFLIISQKFITLFVTLTIILSKKNVLTQLIESFFFSFNGILSISVLIVSGSRVKEAHSKVRELFLDLYSILDKQTVFGIQENEILLMMKTFVQQEHMILTAAEMIPLTRSLFLKIGAALVTYGVLIVQFDQS